MTKSRTLLILINEAALDVISAIDTVRRKGYEDYKKGQSLFDCPHKEPLLAKPYVEGWVQAAREDIDSLVW